jgi:hypothetical protein
MFGEMLSQDLSDPDSRYGFNLIGLKDEDVQNLDDILPRLLLKYGIQAY